MSVFDVNILNISELFDRRESLQVHVVDEIIDILLAELAE